MLVLQHNDVWSSSSDEVFKQLETSENFSRDAGYNEHLSGAAENLC